MTETSKALLLAELLDADMTVDLAAVSGELRRLHAENERLKTVPMKYRRMEFNAQLQAENERLIAQRDALLEALKLAWPIIEKEKFMQDGCYGKNFVQTKADRARSVYDKARAAIAAVKN